MKNLGSKLAEIPDISSTSEKIATEISTMANETLKCIFSKSHT